MLKLGRFCPWKIQSSRLKSIARERFLPLVISGVLHTTPELCLSLQLGSSSQPALTHSSNEDSFPWQRILVNHMGPEPRPNWPCATSSTASENPSCRQTTSASCISNPMLHTACQKPCRFISTRPMCVTLLPFNLTRAVSRRKKSLFSRWGSNFRW